MRSDAGTAYHPRMTISPEGNTLVVGGGLVGASLAIALDAAWIRSAWFHQASFAGWFSQASARGLLTLQREQAAS